MDPLHTVPDTDIATEVARLRAELAWQEAENGTRAEQEEERAASDAEWDRVAAMTDDEVKTVLAAAGITLTFEPTLALIRVAAELRVALEQIETLQKQGPLQSTTTTLLAECAAGPGRDGSGFAAALLAWRTAGCPNTFGMS